MNKLNYINRFTQSIAVILLLVGSVFLHSSCDSSSAERQGIIHYKLTYPYLDDNNLIKGMMPKEMKCYFKDGKQKFELVAGFGIFRSSYIVDSKNKTLINTLKLMNTKLYSELNEEDYKKYVHAKYPEVSIELLDSQKQMAGCQVHEADVSFPQHSERALTLCYTTDFTGIDNSWYTPYNSINGILLEYEIDFFELTTHLVAEKIEFVEVNDNEFNVPEKYKQVSFPEIEKEVHNIFETLAQ